MATGNFLLGKGVNVWCPVDICMRCTVPSCTISLFIVINECSLDVQQLLCFPHEPLHRFLPNKTFFLFLPQFPLIPHTSSLSPFCFGLVFCLIWHVLHFLGVVFVLLVCFSSGCGLASSQGDTLSSSRLSDCWHWVSQHIYSCGSRRQQPCADRRTPYAHSGSQTGTLRTLVREGEHPYGELWYTQVEPEKLTEEFL